jgi:catechol 2,3-dioxygenase-like lactoylglutathione lyase family enzyme
MRIDHVVYAVRDLDAAAERFRDEHGLVSVSGGVHPRWGTGNRLIPLGGQYLELLGVVDPAAADPTALGRALASRTEHGDGWFALCLADDDIELTGARLGLRVEPGSRLRPDGATVAWRGAGIEDPRRSADLPFFIAWDVPPDLHPGAHPPAHPCGATGIARVDVAGDPGAFAGWTAGAELPVRIVADAERGIRAVALATPTGERLVR